MTLGVVPFDSFRLVFFLIKLIKLICLHETCCCRGWPPEWRALGGSVCQEKLWQDMLPAQGGVRSAFGMDFVW